MLSKEEIKLINEILTNLNFSDENRINLRAKTSLICRQLDIMEKAQQEAAEIQEKIIKLGENKDE